MCVVILASMATALGINVHQMTSTPVTSCISSGNVSDEREILFDSNAYLNLLEGPNSVRYGLATIPGRVFAFITVRQTSCLPNRYKSENSAWDRG